VQKALGHASLSTTMIYTHNVDDDMEAAMRLLNI
jgi:integrase